MGIRNHTITSNIERVIHLSYFFPSQKIAYEHLSVQFFTPLSSPSLIFWSSDFLHHVCQR